MHVARRDGARPRIDRCPPTCGYADSRSVAIVRAAKTAVPVNRRNRACFAHGLAHGMRRNRLAPATLEGPHDKLVDLTGFFTRRAR